MLRVIISALASSFCVLLVFWFTDIFGPDKAEWAFFGAWVLLFCMISLFWHIGKVDEPPMAAAWDGLQQGTYHCLGYTSYIAEEKISSLRFMAGKCLPARKLYVCTVREAGSQYSGRIRVVLHDKPLPSEFIWNENTGEATA